MDSKVKNESFLLVNQEFNSFEEFAYIANQWDADFRQLNTEQSRARIFQSQIGSILVSNVHFGCHVEQRGTTPHSMRTFAILSADCPDFYWFGHIVNKDELLVFPTHGEIDCFTRAGFGVTTISIPEDLLSEFFARNGVDDLNKIIGREEIVKKTSIANLNELRSLIPQLKNRLLKNHFNSKQPSLVIDNYFNDKIHDEILLTIFNIMTDNHIPSKNAIHDLPFKNSSSTLQLLLEYIKKNNDELLSISQLCHVAQISERTLQYLFMKHLGMTSKNYMKGQKLYSIHKELWACETSNIEIRNIAHKYGFWHMGQFAADYRKLFGELPSITQNRHK